MVVAVTQHAAELVRQPLPDRRGLEAAVAHDRLLKYAA
jgi:hypothetical protein